MPGPGTPPRGNNLGQIEDITTGDFKNRKGVKALIGFNPLNLLVPEVGIEPTWSRGPGDFESPASTSFTTPAGWLRQSDNLKNYRNLSPDCQEKTPGQKLFFKKVIDTYQ